MYISKLIFTSCGVKSLAILSVIFISFQFFSDLPSVIFFKSFPLPLHTINISIFPIFIYIPARIRKSFQQSSAPYNSLSFYSVKINHPYGTQYLWQYVSFSLLWISLKHSLNIFKTKSKYAINTNSDIKLPRLTTAVTSKHNSYPVLKLCTQESPTVPFNVIFNLTLTYQGFFKPFP